MTSPKIYQKKYTHTNTISTFFRDTTQCLYILYRLAFGSKKKNDIEWSSEDPLVKKNKDRKFANKIDPLERL